MYICINCGVIKPLEKGGNLFRCGKCNKGYAQKWAKDNHEKNCKGKKKK